MPIFGTLNTATPTCNGLRLHYKLPHMAPALMPLLVIVLLDSLFKEGAIFYTRWNNSKLNFYPRNKGNKGKSTSIPANINASEEILYLRQMDIWSTGWCTALKTANNDILFYISLYFSLVFFCWNVFFSLIQINFNLIKAKKIINRLYGLNNWWLQLWRRSKHSSLFK